MNYERGLAGMGAYNRLAIATSAPLTTVNKLAIAPLPTKDDLLGPGNTAPVTPVAAPAATTTKVATSLILAAKPKPGSGLFDFGSGGGSSPAPAPVPEQGAAVGVGIDYERPSREPEPTIEPASFSGGGGGGGGGFFEPAPQGSGASSLPAALTAKKGGVPAWALALGGVAAVGVGLFAFRKKVFR